MPAVRFQSKRSYRLIMGLLGGLGSGEAVRYLGLSQICGLIYFADIFSSEKKLSQSKKNGGRFPKSPVFWSKNDEFRKT